MTVVICFFVLVFIHCVATDGQKRLYTGMILSEDRPVNQSRGNRMSPANCCLANALSKYLVSYDFYYVCVYPSFIEHYY